MQSVRRSWLQVELGFARRLHAVFAQKVDVMFGLVGRQQPHDIGVTFLLDSSTMNVAQRQDPSAQVIRSEPGSKGRAIQHDSSQQEFPLCSARRPYGIVEHTTTGAFTAFRI